MLDDEVFERVVVSSVRHHRMKDGEYAGSVTPRHLAQTVRRAHRFGYTVLQLSDLTVVINTGYHDLTFYPDEDSEPIYDFRRTDRVVATGYQEVAVVDAIHEWEQGNKATVRYPHDGSWVYAPISQIHHVVEPDE